MKFHGGGDIEKGIEKGILIDAVGAGKIDEQERMVVATTEVHEALNAGDTLEREFKQLTVGASSESIEWKLLQLKDMPAQLDCPNAPDAPLPSKSVLVTVA